MLCRVWRVNEPKPKLKMNTATKLTGPFRVETSEPNFLGESAYHAITDQHGAEVARVHCGDDSEATKNFAKLMAAAPQLHAVIETIMHCEDHPEEVALRLKAELNALNWLQYLKTP